MSDLTTRPAAGGYTSTAKALHWILAALIIALIAVGIGREFIPKGPTRDFITMLHKATGIVAGVLMIVRLAYRATNPPPPSEPGLPGWQIGLSHATHWALYAIVIVMPILGWIGSNAGGHPVSMYGLFTLPTIASENKEFGETVFTWHAILGFTALGLIVLHVAAALYHHFGRRDGVLLRMTSEPAR